MRDDEQRLIDILEAIGKIERYADRGQVAAEQDELLQVWFVHHLELIGEAARSLTEAFRSQHPEILWPVIVAMRNVLIHQYFEIDLAEVWLTVERDLPELKRAIEEILRKRDPN